MCELNHGQKQRAKPQQFYNIQLWEIHFKLATKFSRAEITFNCQYKNIYV